jgi:methionine biosynthesis protein MetW
VSGSSPYGALVDRNGLATSHRLVLDLVAPGSRVLDVGCAEGHLAAELTARGCRVVGIEHDSRAARAARDRGVEVLELDVEQIPLAAARFDVVVFADVLEHLRDPAAVLRQARAAGRAVVSLPNIAHWTARRALLRGRFPREDFGLFDRTHLRYFTRADAHALAREAGFTVAQERFADAPLPLESHVAALGRLRDAALERRPELFALQIVLGLDAAPARPALNP